MLLLLRAHARRDSAAPLPFRRRSGVAPAPDRAARRPLAPCATAGGELVLSEYARYRRELPNGSENLSLIAGAPDDFFQLLRLEPDCDDSDAVKKSYRLLLKSVHPDYCGEASHDLAILLVRRPPRTTHPPRPCVPRPAAFRGPAAFRRACCLPRNPSDARTGGAPRLFHPSQNLAYATLSDGEMRRAYRAALKGWRAAIGGSFDGRPMSSWRTDAPEQQVAVRITEAARLERFAGLRPRHLQRAAPVLAAAMSMLSSRSGERAPAALCGARTHKNSPLSCNRPTASQLFVDEAKCIGCKMCALTAPNTFFIDEEHGTRAACEPSLPRRAAGPASRAET